MTILHKFDCKQLVINNENLSALLIEISEQVEELDIIGIEIDTMMDDDGFYWAFILYKEQKTGLKLSENDNNIEINIKSRTQ